MPPRDPEMVKMNNSLDSIASALKSQVKVLEALNTNVLELTRAIKEDIDARG